MGHLGPNDTETRVWGPKLPPTYYGPFWGAIQESLLPRGYSTVTTHLYVGCPQDHLAVCSPGLILGEVWRDGANRS